MKVSKGENKSEEKWRTKGPRSTRLADSDARAVRRSRRRAEGCYSSGAITKLTMAITLMRMFMLGPDVSLNGSPTVSPTTVAA